MKPAMLKHLIEQTETAVRMMARDNSAFHVFDFGTDQNGLDYSCVICIVPTTQIDTVEKLLGVKESRPLDDAQ